MSFRILKHEKDKEMIVEVVDKEVDIEEEGIEEDK